MSHDPPTTRRELLLTAGATAVAGVAGCTGSRSRAVGRSPTVTILAAGSLQNALANGLEPAVDVPVEIETHGSATVARMVSEGQRDPDIVAVADVALLEGALSVPWHAVFASNSVVVAYDPETDGGRRLAEAGTERWYEPMAAGAVDLGRTDPDQDPLGYRTLFVLDLASRYYDVPNLGERILEREQVYPETALLSQFETGSIDAAFAYRNMAVERGYDYLELPAQIDLSDPRYVDDWYATTAYTLPSGREVRGGLVGYGATIRHVNDAALTVFDALTTGDYLEEHGFLLREEFPAYAGDVPEHVSAAAQSADRRPGLGGTKDEPAARRSDGTVLI